LNHFETKTGRMNEECTSRLCKGIKAVNDHGNLVSRKRGSNKRGGSGGSGGGGPAAVSSAAALVSFSGMAGSVLVDVQNAADVARVVSSQSLEAAALLQAPVLVVVSSTNGSGNGPPEVHSNPAGWAHGSIGWRLARAPGTGRPDSISKTVKVLTLRKCAFIENPKTRIPEGAIVIDRKCVVKKPRSSKNAQGDPSSNQHDVALAQTLYVSFIFSCEAFSLAAALR
jgi:hypothetical protein